MIIVDTDGDVTRMVPWLMRKGIHGVLLWSGRPEWMG